MAPPFVAELPMIVELMIVSNSPWLMIAPPEVELPPVIVMPLRVAVVPLSTVITPTAPPPLSVRPFEAVP